MPKQQLIAIVGRPNVGKSSLFNRLTGKRDAIVDDQPGVTRDRHYGTCHWSGKTFTLIDTGGYLPESSDLINTAIKEQVEIAIEQADVILFVVDVRSGVTQTDSEIGQMLTRHDKPVILIVNKVDGEKDELEVYDFYRLGLGEPIPVSALNGRSSGDMLDTISEQIPELDESEDDSIKLAVIGKENVGKSSYVNTLVGENRNIVTHIAGTTRDANDSHLTVRGQKYTIIDTAGLKRRTKVKENILFYSQIRTLQSIDRSDVVLYFIDATEGITNQDQRILGDIVERQKGVVIAANKWDLIDTPSDKHSRDVIQSYRDEIPFLSYVPIVTISAHEKQRVFKLLDMASEVFNERAKRIQTSHLNDFFLPLIKHKKPPTANGQQIKINYVSQVQSNPPVITFFCNLPKLLAAHYKRFLENQFRKEFKFTGVPVKFVYKKKHMEWEDTRA